jgi:hypothetical protein
MAHLGSALSYSRGVIRRRFATLWLATAWPYIVMAACFLISAFIFRAYHDPSQQFDPVTLWHSMGATAKVGVLFAYLASISLPNGFATAGVAVVVWADLHGEAASLASVFGVIGRVFLRLTILSLCIGILCTIGGAFLYLPGVLAAAFLSFAIPVLVIEDAKVSTALRRGVKLASQRIGALLGLYAIVLFVIVAALVGMFSVGPIADLPSGVGIIVFWSLFVSLVPIGVMGISAAVVRLYRDLREQGELAASTVA